jgi:hypothetical protein
MFIGHYGVSFAAKQKAPELSLGWTFLAVQFLDVLFMSFLLLGVEHMRLVPGLTAVNPYDLYDMPISHSLVGAAGWSVVVFGVAKALRRSTAVAGVLAFAVFSHFLLDLPMHTPDMSIAGGSTPKLGLGLWNHRALSMAAELVTLVTGAALYAKARWPLRPRAWIFFGALLALAVATPFFPPPPSNASFAAQGLVGYVVLALWAGWVDRARSRA